ncbi:hypothetical protein [Lactobacillus jensenii]|uniref:hypothetical protein n=1 Tax=Lactobacillus jensenii TaxID=109790 RepID=UPI0022432548|nr:hypothetical protein [Lactobacillus jensenii]MCW8070808.1 hypothetical protein [Lactobacillus jensenii]MDK8234814.1 hypothetical protein [Lactobacillus jensenii]MDT9585419.1 hypothetical protein [Lactobacillus jensenii]
MLLGLAFWSLTLRILELILAIGLALFLVYLAFMAIIFVGTISYWLIVKWRQTAEISDYDIINVPPTEISKKTLFTE